MCLRFAPLLGSHIIHGGKRNGKRGNETGSLGCYNTCKWWSEGCILSMVVIQDSRVYMLCKVAQVFMLEEVGLFFLFASPFSGEESKYITLTDKVCVPHTPVL